MITTSQLSEFWHEWAKTIVAILAAGMVSVIVFAVQAWADQNYVQHKGLASAVAERDLKDINRQLDDLELEIQRTQIWLRFLPQTEQAMRQIYGAELDVLKQAKEKAIRRRQEAMDSVIGVASEQ